MVLMFNTDHQSIFQVWFVHSILNTQCQWRSFRHRTTVIALQHGFHLNHPPTRTCLLAVYFRTSYSICPYSMLAEALSGMVLSASPANLLLAFL